MIVSTIWFIQGVLIGFKLIGNRDWSWWQVFAPLIILAVLQFLIGFIYGFKRGFNKAYKRKGY